MRFSFNSVVVIVALLVWGVWLTLLGPHYAFGNLLENWKYAFTMIFGSMVAGATSLGGGAVAFPVFTKLFDMAPADAKIFSLAIQSVGMGAATTTIFFNRIKVDWRIIRWGTLGGAAGICIGLPVLANILPSDAIKMSFTLMLASFAITLLIANQSKFKHHNQALSRWTMNEKSIVLLAGFLGGIMSGLVGNGIDVFVFATMVLLFRITEKVATPTSVVLMAFNAIAGLILQSLVLKQFTSPVLDYWLAAVPVVVVGAPLGVLICARMSRQTIANVLIGLISLELLSSILFVRFSPLVIYTSLTMFVIFSFVNYRMYDTKTYECIPESIQD